MADDRWQRQSVGGRPREERCDKVGVVCVGGVGRRAQGMRRASGLRGWRSSKFEDEGKERRRGGGGGKGKEVDY